MKFYRSLILENKPLPFKETFDFSSRDLSGDYPLLEIVEAKGEGEVFRYEKGIAVYLKAKARIALSDARTCKRIERTLAYEDEFDLIETPEDEEREGYLFPENEIDLDEVYFCSLRSHIPFNATDAKELPTSDADIHFYEEGEETKEGSPFDSLLSLDKGGGE